MTYQTCQYAQPIRVPGVTVAMRCLVTGETCFNYRWPVGEQCTVRKRKEEQQK